jgi:hypothetical protein
MPDQPGRVTPSEISDLLDQLRSLKPDSPFSERLAYFETKASILSRIAADLDTPEAHIVAADAWHHLSVMCREAHEAKDGRSAR